MLFQWVGLEMFIKGMLIIVASTTLLQGCKSMSGRSRLQSTDGYSSDPCDRTLDYPVLNMAVAMRTAIGRVDQEKIAMAATAYANSIEKFDALPNNVKTFFGQYMTPVQKGQVVGIPLFDEQSRGSFSRAMNHALVELKGSPTAQKVLIRGAKAFVAVAKAAPFIGMGVEFMASLGPSEADFVRCSIENLKEELLAELNRRFTLFDMKYNRRNSKSESDVVAGHLIKIGRAHV